MRIIIAGGRDFGNRENPQGGVDWAWHDECDSLLHGVMYRLFQGGGEAPDWRGYTILSGMARGADTLGATWARQHGVELEEHPADWDAHGRGAGAVRNLEMAAAAEALVAFWDGQSKGTKHMIDAALKQGLEVHVYRYDEDERF